jgi:iron-sulfur cluster repair protein YtfE (RIC family)
MYQNHSEFFTEGEIMNAIELLKEDHNKVSRLFQKVKGSEESEHKELFEKIKAELEVHTHIEETIFYPKIKEEPELEDIVLEGIEEHHQAKIFLRELSALTDDSQKFEPKLKVLMEDVEHHVQEEEGEMFPKIEELFDQSVLEELGREMEKEKQNFKKSQTAGTGR